MSKFIKITLTSIFVLLVIIIVGLVVVINVSSEEKEEGEQTIEDMVQYSFDTEEMTTDLLDDSFVRMQFRIITDSQDGLEEVSQRDFQITNILIKELSLMETEDFTSNLDELEDKIKNELNVLMTEGEITDVYTIKKLLQ